MSKEQEIFERAISNAYARQIGSSPDSTFELRNVVVKRGRRRRTVRVAGSIALVAAIATGAAASVGVLRDDRDRRQVVDDAPTFGAKKLMESGGPIVATSEALYVANDQLMNDAADKANIARFDLATRDVTNTDPSTMSSPQSVALGAAGLWMVQWTGDIGDSGHAHGTIQLADPDTGEVLLDLPRDDSAPYDVAVADVSGRESAFVLDAARNQLVVVDAVTGKTETTQLDDRPFSVAAGPDAIWIGGDAGNRVSSLIRYDLSNGSLETFSVDHCLSDLVVVDGSVWVSDGCDGFVREFDAGTGEELTAVGIGGSPSAITSAAGLIWVARGDDVVRVDPSADQVVGDPIVVPTDFFGAYFAVVDDRVFVSSGLGGVYELGEGFPIQERPPPPAPEPRRADPLTSETCQLDHVLCIGLDREWSIAGAGFGSGWVGNIGEGKTFGIARFDAATGDEIARLDADGFVQEFAPDENWMWALVDSHDHLSLIKIDPSTTTVRSEYELGHAGSVGEASIAAGGGYVWVSQPGGSVTRIGADDGETVTTTYADELPGYGPSDGPLELAYGEHHLWLSYGRGHLGMVDPSSGDLIRLDEDALGENAYEIIVAASAVWSPHQSPKGDNEISYSLTSGPDGDLDRVLLVPEPPGHAATDGDHIWVVQQGSGSDEAGWLTEIDAQAHEMVGFPLELHIGFEGDVAVGDGYVWVTGNEVLYRIDPSG